MCRNNTWVQRAYLNAISTRRECDIDISKRNGIRETTLGHMYYAYVHRHILPYTPCSYPGLRTRISTGTLRSLIRGHYSKPYSTSNERPIRPLGTSVQRKTSPDHQYDDRGSLSTFHKPDKQLLAANVGSFRSEDLLSRLSRFGIKPPE